MKLWQKDYTLDQQIEDFTVGDDYLLDQQLVKYDCLGSIAHAKMLGQIGILNDNEVQALINELNQIIRLDEEKQFKIAKKQEDCHTAIENHLTAKLGALGKKIHTARSRNDQVLTALRLYYKTELNGCIHLAQEFSNAVVGFCQRHGDIQLPGYTHTRKAMPSSIRLWGQAWVDSMADNLKLLDFTLNLIDQCPLGTGAGYGLPIELNREYIAQELGFARVQQNPIYTQTSRGKFEATILHALGQIMYDLNKIASDLILFSLPEFGYFELPPEFCTGSSIMPQKQNPDVLELLRAKYHVLLAYEVQIKNLIGNLLSGYNRDIQLTKAPTMRALQTTAESLKIGCLIFVKLKVNEDKCKQAMTSEVMATEEVYKLVNQGIPFRDAYQIIAKKNSPPG